MNKLNIKNKQLEQYGRRLYIIVEGVPTDENKTMQEIFDKIVSLINNVECDVLEFVINRALRIAISCIDKKSSQYSKSIMIKCTTLDIELDYTVIKVN